MNTIFKNYLFEKHLFVNEGTKGQEDNRSETLFALAKLFGIRIVAGEKLVQESMIGFTASMLGENVPEPFYRGFPQSVRELTSDQLLFDQILHYFQTYWLGDFSEPGHSVFEKDIERSAFKENVQIKDFSVVTEDEAVSLLAGMVEDLLAGTRPLSDDQFMLVKTFIKEYDYKVTDIASKNTCVKLLRDTRDIRYADYMNLSDVIKLVDDINFEEYGSQNIRKLNLKNKDRKFIESVIDLLIDLGRCDIRTCFEKKKIWNGLLHHIHYKAKSPDGQVFVDAMRGNVNNSVYAEFEKAMSEKQIKAAIDALIKGKGSGAFLRNVNYIVSRCETLEDTEYVVNCMDTRNILILLQLLLQYSNYTKNSGARTFKFTRYNQLRVHTETYAEVKKRKSVISNGQANMLARKIMENLKSVLKNRLGKVYIDPDMANYALPVQENTSQGGFGVLPKGSRIHIGEMKKLRGFTYWEKVNDIDLSVFGIDKKGHKTEFSWRTMSGRQSGAITYSGDETSGYNGGSEYFDIDMDQFRKKYPDMRYIVFCDNVYSRIPFNKCYCRAGYMLRDVDDSGLIYEPKTVQSAFTINADGLFAYLFGIDLDTNDMIWLNMARSGSINVAGDTSMEFLMQYFHVTEIINVASFFEMMAEEVVDDISEAEVVVTNKHVECEEGVEVIREYDFEKMIRYMNQR